MNDGGGVMMIWWLLTHAPNIHVFQTIEKVAFKKAVWAVLLGTSKVIRKYRFPRGVYCIYMCLFNYYLNHLLGDRKAERDGTCSKIGAFIL